MSSLELILAIGLIAFSGFMSSSEIALFSLSRFQLRSLKEKFRSSHKKIKRLLQDASGVLITILIVNEMINITLSSLITRFTSRASESLHLKEPIAQKLGIPIWGVEALLGVLITAPVILFLCEITPKIIGTKINVLIAPLTAGPLHFIYEVFTPIRAVVKKIVQWITRISGKPINTEQNTILNEADFLLMVEEGHKEGAIQQSEFELIKNIFEMNETQVVDIYTPIYQVQTLSMNTNLKDALTFMRMNRYSRIPITGRSKNEIVGILYSKDLLKAKVQPELLKDTVSEIMRNPITTTKSMKLNALFRKFKLQKSHMAIVMGESDEAIGVVTMNDVLDAVFEDIIPDDDDYLASYIERKGGK